MVPPSAAAELHPAPGARFSRYPITAFDSPLERSTFITGWLVEGKIDTKALGAALRRVTEKWRILGGRLESIPDSKSWQVRVPLDPLPKDYCTYVLTESTSDVPLSAYVAVPLETSSQALPQSLFLHPSTPRQNADWMLKSHPLTCWHVTHFPSHVAGESPYSCIGFARSHGIFDGIGASAVMRALVAEMSGREWDIPPPPPEGSHPNPINEVLSKKLAEGNIYPPPCYSPIGLKGALWMVGWHLRERYWGGAVHRIFAVDKQCLQFLVDGVKSEVRHENPDVKVTSGDVLTAWCMKVIYKTGTSPQTVVHCTNFASFRDLISQAGGESMAHYLHNAWIPLPYPTLTVKELNSLTIPEFSLALSQARQKLSLDHVVSSHQLLADKPFSMPIHPDADETLAVSNVSASRILESDWSGVGSRGTVGGYRFSATPNNLVIGNRVYFSGRLPDGTTILDVNLNKVRMQNLATAIEKLKLKVPVG
ncbi:hypothetical protein DFH08DRAFT_928270 [Mycena albidolilacea]|uniref:Uncharacterized protein n=1 Tax=Mycena albidolilacea TaxID=1033008 RepID=A0AAD7AUJ0_9AGAR|nr:hypothetical protein DFH08DRAFT_928270 [Mycena albidolilacea]